MSEPAFPHDSSSQQMQALKHWLEDWAQSGVQQLPVAPEDLGALKQLLQRPVARPIGTGGAAGAPSIPPVLKADLARGESPDASSPVPQSAPNLDSPLPRLASGPQPSLFGSQQPEGLPPPSEGAGSSMISVHLENRPKWQASSLPIAERTSQLEVLATEVAGCRKCKGLASTRTQTVFGVGNVKPRLVFLGEAPGADEDRQGEPFVGRAGQLLNDIIKACTLRREDVYILNTIKCRPPENRNPLPEEMLHCRGFLDRQLEILRPEFICCLGAVATKALFEKPGPLGKLRGKFFPFRGAQVVVTYHPAYLLRNPPAKKDTWEDMKMLLKAMGIPLK